MAKLDGQQLSCRFVCITPVLYESDDQLEPQATWAECGAIIDGHVLNRRGYIRLDEATHERVLNHHLATVDTNGLFGHGDFDVYIESLPLHELDFHREAHDISVKERR